MSIYYNSQLTGSNGHVTGIDSPVPQYKAVAQGDRYESRIQDLVNTGLDGIEKYERFLDNMRIQCCIDIDARSTGRWIVKQARERLEQK